MAVFPRSVFLRPRFFLHEDELIETELKRFKKDDSAKINKKCPAYENAISLFVENHGSPQCSITSKNKSFREPCAARKRDVLGRSKTTEYKGVAATPARYGSIANDTSCHHKKKKRPLALKNAVSHGESSLANCIDTIDSGKLRHTYKKKKK